MRKYLNQAEFARHKGYENRSYVTHLKNKGLLVMNGKMVDVAATEELMEQMSDPAKADNGKIGAAVRKALKESEISAPVNEKDKDEELQGKIGSVYQHSRALNEKYKAMTAKRDYEIAMGRLLEAEAVAEVISEAAGAVRRRLEALPDSLAPMLAAEHDEGRIRALLIDQVEHTLAELSRQFNKAVPRAG